MRASPRLVQQRHRHQRHRPGQRLDARRHPQSRRRLEAFVEQRARHQRHQAACHQQGAMQILLHARQPRAQHQRHARQAQAQPEHLAPTQPLTQHGPGQHPDQQRIGADQHRRERGRHRRHATPAQAKVGRVVQDPQKHQRRQIAGAGPRPPAAGRGHAEHQGASDQEANGQQGQRRTVAHRDLGRRERRAPQETECRDGRPGHPIGASAGRAVAGKVDDAFMAAGPGKGR